MLSSHLSPWLGLLDRTNILLAGYESAYSLAGNRDARNEKSFSNEVKRKTLQVDLKNWVIRNP